MPERLDAKDQRILSALSMNARQSLSSIGRKVGLSEEVVNYRLRSLLQRGIITWFRTEIDARRLGYKWYRLYMRLEGADAKKEQEIFEYLAGRKGAYWTAICEGKYNLIFRFAAKDEFELNEIINDISTEFSQYIRDRDITIPLEAHSYSAESGAYGERGERYDMPKRKGLVEVDSKDLGILSILANNARAPGSEIAKKVGLTPNAVRYRIKRLEQDGVIERYQVVVDRSKIGKYHYKLLLHLQKTNEEKVKKFVKHCESMPNLVFLTRSIGAWDLDADFDFSNTLELHNSVLALTSRFRELIRNYETLSIVKFRDSNPLKA